MTNKSLSIALSVAMMILSTKVVLAAPKLYLDPTSLSPTKNQEFSISLKIDVEANQVIGSDTTINYAGDSQEVVGVDNANFFSEFTWANNAVGKLEIHAFTPSIYQTKTGNGTIATIKFKSKKDSGSSALTFNCTGTGNDTNILNNNGQNILTCGNLNQSNIIYIGASAPAPTPTSTPNPSNIAPKCESVTLNQVSTIGIPQAITFSCKGSDSDSSITAAEFTFGDGTEPLIVSKNIGREGVIETTHTYTKTGNINVKCRMRDDWSLSSICSKALTIKLAPVISPAPKPKSTPSGKILSLVDESNLATPTPSPSETPSPETSKSRPSAFWWIFPILLLIGLIYLIYRYYNSSPPRPTEY